MIMVGAESVSLSSSLSFAANDDVDDEADCNTVMNKTREEDGDDEHG